MEMKVCRKCCLEKPIAEFSVAEKATRRLKAQCKACESARVRAYYASNEVYREKSRAKNRALSKLKTRDPDKARQYALKGKYNLTTEQYEALIKQQNDRCRLCRASDVGRTHGKWHRGHWMIDHCHNDGRVRGLLCHDCNTQLGGYETLLEKVGEAALLEYLTAPSPVPPTPLPVVPVYRTMEPPPVRDPSPPCEIEGCGEISKAHNLCVKHYARFLRAGSVKVTPDLAQRSVRGETHKPSKLTEDDVRHILWSQESGVALAKKFGVTTAHISSIRHRKTWQHVDCGVEFVSPKPRQLTEQDVRDIRASTERGMDLAAKYNISRASVCDIQKRRSWKHVN